MSTIGCLDGEGLRGTVVVSTAIAVEASGPAMRRLNSAVKRADRRRQASRRARMRPYRQHFLALEAASVRMSRDDFSKEVIHTLARRVNHRCSMPTCRQDTSGPRSDSAKSVCIGVAAHITAAAPGGPRYDHSLSSDQRRSAANGIWLCQNHAKLVDNDAVRYSADTLRGWKQDAESAASAALERGAAIPGEASVQPSASLAHAESLADLAARTARAARHEEKRRRFTHSEEGVHALRAEFVVLRDSLRAQAAAIQSAVAMEVLEHDEATFSVRTQRIILSVRRDRGRFDNDLDGWKVLISAWRGASPFMGALSHSPERVGQRIVTFDLEPDGLRWVESASERQRYTSAGLAEVLLRWLIGLISAER